MTITTNPPSTTSPEQAAASAAHPDVAALFSLIGKVAIVTGGSRGLGKVVAFALAQAGATVAITARREQWLRPTLEELRQGGHQGEAIVCDVTDPAQVESCVDQVERQFGRVDVLFNNAGISWGAPSLEMPPDRFRQVLEVNTTGAFLMSQAVARRMVALHPTPASADAYAPDAAPPGGSSGVADAFPTRAGLAGKIVNVSSIMGLRGMPAEVLAAAGYSASKGALIALTRALATEWAPQGITVNALAPGFFPTRMSEGVIAAHAPALVERIPLGRLGTPRDLSGVAVFLASPASDYITGQVLALDGGATAW